MKAGILFPLAALFLAAACTSNPLSDNNISNTPNTVSGTVLLRGGDEIENAYIWLQGFNSSARSDAAGEFSLTIPSSGVSGGAVDGVFDLFAYVANCRVESRSLAVRNSQFVFSQGGITSKGKLSPDIQLTQFLKIRTDASVAEDADNPRSVTLRAIVTLQSTGGTVPVSFPFQVDGISGPLIIRHLESGEVKIISTVIAGIANPNPEVTQAAHIRTMNTTLRREDFKSGKHEVIPYLLLENTEVPPGLKASLGSGVEALGSDYLKLPFLREGGLIDLPESIGAGN